MNWISLNGMKSSNIAGLVVKKLPPISVSGYRWETTEIDGRNDRVLYPLGEKGTVREVTIAIYDPYGYDAAGYETPRGEWRTGVIQNVISWLESNRQGWVCFSSEPNYWYEYIIADQIDFEKFARFRQATIRFDCQAGRGALMKGADLVVDGTTIPFPISIYHSSDDMSTMIHIYNRRFDELRGQRFSFRFSKSTTGTNYVRIAKFEGDMPSGASIPSSWVVTLTGVKAGVEYVFHPTDSGARLADFVGTDAEFEDGKGDVDFDETITAADASLALRASAGMERLSPDQIKRADMDNDGFVTAKDARGILNLSVQITNGSYHTVVNGHTGSLFLNAGTKNTLLAHSNEADMAIAAFSYSYMGVSYADPTQGMDGFFD